MTFDETAVNLAVKNNMDVEKVVSAYLIAGKQFFYLLRCFEGQVLKIPSKRRLQTATLKNIVFIEDDDLKYADYKKHNVLEHNGVEYTVVAKEKKILNHYYIPVVRSEDEDGN